ncbi:MAG TPA: MBL fold metallo-hydrolase [Anaerolineales bacterium]|nr:MBL fold metallo-hydrolase [Anaerolineales bacterium]HRQ91893.1 MBL fold metallo-hydrolase [Anaerolineales bacterium]
MQIRFLGAAQTVTGSQHLLEINGRKLLLDCGLFQGPRKEAAIRNTTFKFDAKELDAVILSHAHIDHSGNLPNLVKSGYAGPIHAQNATADLCKVMLEDSAHIQESDAAHLNRRLKNGEPPVVPLYTVADANQADDQFVDHKYNTPFQVLPGIQATFIEAGHILGSAAIALDIDDHGAQRRFWFSGDIGRPGLTLIKDPVMPSGADTLLMESTYGDRNHLPPEHAAEQLRTIIGDTLRRGGKVIIPAFAVGRTQEIVYHLHELMASGDIPKVPVFVDSPLAVNVTDIFRRHPDCLDDETRTFLQEGNHTEALGFDMLTYIRSVDESKALNDRKEPMIIISASGMMEVGRVLHHLEHNVMDERSLVLIVSWMAPHTLGRRLVEGAERIRIFGTEYDRKIRVATVNGFSAHAGQDGLREYAAAVKDTVRNIFLVHGEQGPALALKEKLNEDGFGNVYYPAMGDVKEI